MSSTHAPSAGTNRIRFNGFAGVPYAASISGPRGHPSVLKKILEKKRADRADQAAHDQNHHGQESHAVAHFSFGRVLDISVSVELSADQIDYPKRRRDQGTEIMREQIDSRQKSN